MVSCVVLISCFLCLAGGVMPPVEGRVPSTDIGLHQLRPLLHRVRRTAIRLPEYSCCLYSKWVSGPDPAESRRDTHSHSLGG